MADGRSDLVVVFCEYVVFEPAFWVCVVYVVDVIVVRV